MSKKVLVTGAAGQLGKDVVNTLTEAGYEVHGFGHAELDITNMNQVEQVLGEVQPDIVVHQPPTQRWIKRNRIRRRPLR
jgi:dTDP-4-dehydrorhamnose reductase